MQSEKKKYKKLGNSIIELSKDEIAARKKSVFDSMGKRGQNRILKQGYDKWDPFEEPKDPIDIRENEAKATTQSLIREFLQTCESETYGNTFARGAFDMCLGIINKEEKYLGMLAFAEWYAEKVNSGHKEEK